MQLVRSFVGYLSSSHFVQIEDHPLVSFLPLNLASTDSLETVISHIDYAMQYGEDEEPKEVSLSTNTLRSVLILAATRPG